MLYTTLEIYWLWESVYCYCICANKIDFQSLMAKMGWHLLAISNHSPVNDPSLVRSRFTLVRLSSTLGVTKHCPVSLQIPSPSPNTSQSGHWSWHPPARITTGSHTAPSPSHLTSSRCLTRRPALPPSPRHMPECLGGRRAARLGGQPAKALHGQLRPPPSARGVHGEKPGRSSPVLAVRSTSSKGYRRYRTIMTGTLFMGPEWKATIVALFIFHASNESLLSCSPAGSRGNGAGVKRSVLSDQS